MSAARGYASNWLRWRSGRQATGYEKLLLAINPFVVPFDVYLLRYKTGSEIPPHTDPVDGRRHYRLNVVLRHANKGGRFQCSKTIYNGSRVKLFRPDAAEHSVSRIEAGTRYVLSIGWVRPGIDRHETHA
ncbi:MAG: 2OG-Fe(II) oxygenase [Pseudomonadota bacterium]